MTQVTVNIKNSWDQVTIGEYQQIIELVQRNIEDKAEENAILLEILSDRDRDFFLDIPLSMMQKCLSQLDFLATNIEAAPVKRFYILGGKKFEVTGTARKISSASARQLNAIQYIDYAQNVKHTKDGQPVMSFLHKEMAIFVLPVGKTYGDDDFNVMENAELIQQYMPITDALGVSAFFLEQFDVSIWVMAGYLERKIKKAKKGTELDEQLRQLKILKSLIRSRGVGDGVTDSDRSKRNTRRCLRRKLNFRR